MYTYMAMDGLYNHFVFQLVYLEVTFFCTDFPYQVEIGNATKSRQYFIYMIVSVFNRKSSTLKHTEKSKFEWKQMNLSIRRSIKGLVSDSNIFLWHKTIEDIRKRKLFPKFQLIPTLRLQVMHAYVHWHCSIDASVKISLVDEHLCEIYSCSHWNLFHCRNLLLGGELQINKKIK